MEGFAPELAVVTHGGGEELEEKLVVRPTSETIIGYMYSKWIKSWRDLPILIVQWGSVLRWEFAQNSSCAPPSSTGTKVTPRTPRRRSQRGNVRILDIYERFCLNEAAIPVIKGTKSETERFAGAQITTSIEAMMWDKRALQSGTSHYFGQNFAKAFEIQYLDQEQHPAILRNNFVGDLHPHHRRDHHGARRRPGTGPASPPRAHPGCHRAHFQER